MKVTPGIDIYQKSVSTKKIKHKPDFVIRIVPTIKLKQLSVVKVEKVGKKPALSERVTTPLLIKIEEPEEISKKADEVSKK